MEERDFEGNERFFRIFRNLNPATRQKTCILVDGKPYSWNVAYEEIFKKSEIGKKILKKLIELKLI